MTAPSDKPEARGEPFPYDWLKAVTIEDRLKFEKEHPNHAWIGPHAAEVVIKLYDAAVKRTEEAEAKLAEVDPLIPKALMFPHLIKERDEALSRIEKLRAALEKTGCVGHRAKREECTCHRCVGLMADDEAAK